MAGSRTRSAPRHKKDWDGNVYGLALVGQGGIGFVFAIDEERVVKIPAGSDVSVRAFRRERAAFKILGTGVQSKYLLTCLDYHLRDRLVLERCVGTVRERLQEQASAIGNGSPRWQHEELMKCSVTWAYQAAEGLSFVHSKNIVHADVGCHNLLLDDHDNVKISDFSGSPIPKKDQGYLPALVSYDTRSRKPGTSGATKETDIFALGSVIYELATGHLPYFDLPDEQVTGLFATWKWPDDMTSIRTEYPVMAVSILDCWEGDIGDAREIAIDLKPEEMHNLSFYQSNTPLPRTPGISSTSSYSSSSSNDTGSDEKQTTRKRRRRKKKKPEISLFSRLRSYFNHGWAPITDS
ncbi:kinase-like domain-containing protein [Plectosphaerella cucumerina]|uniref:Kinase-like domain-containing protein n=1 Tax=Plectosphaerella cucumerina TaxID=40658 RepID=A0A8K0T930_9PEZI|nr:kinase-like domain-containing protein [Plectosphaerella cucumerina]